MGKLSKVLHAVLHVVAAVAQVVNVSALPSKYQPIVAGAVGLLQMGLALSQQGGSSVQVSK